MGLATTPPGHYDFSLVTSDDRIIGARWVEVDDETPVPIAAAVMTMRFAGMVHVIDSTTPGDPHGWVDLDHPGVVLVTLPTTMWPGALDGTWDLVATKTNGDVQCLLRGRFSAEKGVLTT